MDKKSVSHSTLVRGSSSTFTPRIIPPDAPLRHAVSGMDTASSGRQATRSSASAVTLPRATSLPFRLIADTDVQLNELFGTWIEKSMYGRKYMGTERTTFIIDADHRIERILRGKEVKTKEHASQILKN